MTIRYLSVTEVAKRLGISAAAVSAYKLPEPDATIGKTRGWEPETIDQWNASRPGRGVGGGRPPKKREKPDE
jgi:predicted DNA-binding transcriptional regulator AlpA